MRFVMNRMSLVALLMFMGTSAVSAAEVSDWTSTLDLYAKVSALHTPGLHLTNGIVFCVVHLSGESGERDRRTLEGRAMLQTFALARNAFPGLSAKVSLQRQTVENVHDGNAFRYAVAFSEAELAAKAKEGREAAAIKEREEAVRKEREEAIKKEREEAAKREREEAAKREQEQAANEDAAKPVEGRAEVQQAATPPVGVELGVSLSEANKDNEAVVTNTAPVANPLGKNVRRNPTLDRTPAGLVIEDDQTDLLGE